MKKTNILIMLSFLALSNKISSHHTDGAISIATMVVYLLLLVLFFVALFTIKDE